MKKRKVSAKQVAERAGVSQTTVSMVLNNYENTSFSEETKERIFKACDELGYKASPGRSVNRDSSQILLAVCPSMLNPHYVKAIVGIQQRAAELGYEVIVYSTQRSRSKEACLVQLCRAMNVAGVLLTYRPDNQSAFRLISMEFQLVQLYEKFGNDDVNALETDNFKVGYAVTNHLIELGHKYIAVVSRPMEDNQPARVRRVDGVKSAMAAHGLDHQTYLTVATLQKCGFGTLTLEGYETGYLLAGHLLDTEPKITAFVATNDIMAYGIMDAILERGKRIPQDYSVCGCDNLLYSKFRRLSLTTVEEYVEERGRDAVDILVQKIKLKNASSLDEGSPVSITKIEYEPKLLVRKSSGKARTT